MSIGKHPAIKGSSFFFLFFFVSLLPTFTFFKLRILVFIEKGIEDRRLESGDGKKREKLSSCCIEIKFPSFIDIDFIDEPGGLKLKLFI